MEVKVRLLRESLSDDGVERKQMNAFYTLT